MKRGGGEILVRLADGTACAARVMLGWRPLADRHARLEWCLAMAEQNTLLLAVRARGSDRAVGAPAPDANVVTADDARMVVQAHGGAAKLAEDAPLGWNLLAKGFLRESDVNDFLSMQYRVPTINLREYEVAPDVIALLSRELCSEHCVLPVSRAGRSLIVAMPDPTNHFARDAVAAATGFTIEPVIADEPTIRLFIERYYG